MKDSTQMLSWTCRALQATLLGLIVVATQNQLHPSVGSQSPQATVETFYKWYIHALIQNRDPLTDERSTLRKYVSPELLTKIDKLAKDPDGLDADYFTQAQDYFDDWETHIAVTKPLINHTVATVMVTLGANDHRQKLKISLIKAADAWKIQRIHVQRPANATIK